MLGQCCQCRTTGIGQAEQLGGFVEGLAGSVIGGLAQQPVASDAVHLHQLGMAA